MYSATQADTEFVNNVMYSCVNSKMGYHVGEQGSKCLFGFDKVIAFTVSVPVRIAGQ